IGNNSCGAHSAAYGKTVDNLESMDVLLYDGTRLTVGPTLEADLNYVAARGGAQGTLYTKLRDLRDRYASDVRDGFPRLPRRVSGYNLDELLPENDFNLARALVGSEGTLGITLSARVRAVAKPKTVAMVILGFEDVFHAADQMWWILPHRPEALEGFDEKLPEFARRRSYPGVKLLPKGNAFLIAELGGFDQDEARERAENLIRDARVKQTCTGAAYVKSIRDQNAVWKIRESGLGSSAYFPPLPRTWPGAEDLAVPPSSLGVFLRRFAAILERRDLKVGCYYGHFGEGCVHARISFDLASAKGIATFRATMEELAGTVAEFGGSLSGEHGDGLARAELLPKIFNPKLIDAFRDFKKIFDPGNMMNPGNLVDPFPLDSHLKQGAAYRPRALKTHFDYTADGGLDGATLRCVGIGKCRQTDAGTMCPSYMATREEMHSTRGRARILFEALTGDTLSKFTDDSVRRALDLCLSCKSCKSECPSSVDIAKYKAEFLAHYYDENPRPRTARLFGNIHELAQRASRVPHLANALANAPIISSVGRRMLDIHPQRQLPRLAAQTFRAWFETHPGTTDQMRRREVVLFPDTFTNFFEPEVAIAAVAVLERANFRVVIPEQDLCCGRPLYDQGMLVRAKERLQESMDALVPMVDRGAYVVGLEPSCLLTFRDELPSLFPNNPRAQMLCERSLLFDEFLAREGIVPPQPKPLSRKAILHGHCHQKALVGLDTETAVLGRVDGLEVDVLDAGCCGMAGPFGYEDTHFAVSKACADRVLVPAIEASDRETIVISDGFSCRAQIRQFCPGRRPMHLAQVLHLAMQGEGALTTRAR
ncbi:MAG TPA: FAD-linked oxidase C-terminal domain-containing protein, partial [Candidatus Binataceae bacterium]|nr:FAD-linked oxidase C-terminal domain-containing protein [Candidatus Binataceae bacterium]